MCANGSDARQRDEQVEDMSEWRAAPIKRKRCNYAGYAQELADANMKPGRPIGSWTMPEPLVRSASGTGVSNSRIIRQTALIGTLLNDKVTQHPDMLLQ
jgi:hypothetical protein